MRPNWNATYLTSAVPFAVLLAGVPAPVSADPQLTSWFNANAGQYARVYTTTNARASGTSVVTWTGQSLPAYADVAEVSHSASWIYVKYTGLASHIMGPWLTPTGGQFMFWPTNQHGISRFPRSPTVPSGNKNTTGIGYSGIYVNGVAIFNSLDGKAWNGSALVMGPHTQLTYYWHRNAPVGEGFNFDYALGHQPPSGVYHTHQNPIALRYQLGDHVDFDPGTKNYSESASAITKHSPVIGWAYDGYPVYGPYGYSVSTNSSSGVRRMFSGYVERDGSSGSDSVASNLSTIPAWYARFRQKLGAAYSTSASTARPAVSATYPLGTFAEDWSYLGDLTNSATSQPYRQGTDFDLDQYSGRYCVTPEFPNGTYAYFVANDSNGNGTYPYVLGYEYYGNATGGSVSSINESVTVFFTGGANASLLLSPPAITNNTVTLVWSATEGGTYVVEASGNLSTWKTNASGIAAVLNRGSTYTAKVSTNQYFRVLRTSLAAYDPN
jgi:hypothetical protein